MTKLDNAKLTSDYEQADTMVSNRWQVTLGMPHLADRGLSENWLYRDCGHSHWELISKLTGCQSGQIVDALGNRLYASFVSVSLSGSLAPFRENEKLRVESSLHPVSSKRFMSRHLIRGERGQVELSMVSAFIKQKHKADNRSFVSAPPHIPGLSGKKTHCPLLDDYKQARAYLDEEPIAQPAFNYVVVPAVDFNGARFLYFANFQAIEDRAYHFFTGHSGFHTIDRVVHFYGNVNRSETVEVSLLHHETHLQMDRTVTVLRRKSDSQPLAVIDTRRFVS